MIIFNLIPRFGIGPIVLSMNRDCVRALWGEPDGVQVSHRKWGINFCDRDYYFQNAFQICYDKNLKVEFIEVAKNPKYRVLFLGIDVHGNDIDSLFAALQSASNVEKADREYPINQIYPAIDLTIFRDGDELSSVFAIGIGVDGYCKKLIKLI